VGSCTICQGPQVAAGRLQLADPLLDSLQPSIDQLCDVLARRFARVADLENTSDLTEGEARGLGMTDEGQTIDDRRLVVPVRRRRPGGLGKEIEFLPEADRLGRHARAGRNFSNPHP